MTQNNKTMVAWDWILPSKLQLMTPKIQLQRYILCTMLPEHKTTIENKAYNLPSDVIKLMAYKTCSVHTKKQSFMERWLFKIKNPHCTETWKYFSKVLYGQSWPDHTGTSKRPCPTRGRNWWWKRAVCLRKTKKAILHPAHNPPLFLWL